MTTITPVFTRYLYEVLQVKYSLALAVRDKHREESLFWAYELYHSGFQDDVWRLIRQVYVSLYEETNPRFKRRLDKYYTEWKQTGDDCLLGTVVGTLAVRSTNDENEKLIILLYKIHRHATVEKYSGCFAGGMQSNLGELCSQEFEKYSGCKAEGMQSNLGELCSQGFSRKYLAKVSLWPIRQDAIRMAENDGLLINDVREAYLGTNWLYYCAGSPVWLERIHEHGGSSDERSGSSDERIGSCDERIGSCDERNRGFVAFKTDDDLEAFYEKWGLEPDEQTMEMHLLHGIYYIKSDDIL
jgi:hypothetical protein